MLYVTEGGEGGGGGGGMTLHFLFWSISVFLFAAAGVSNKPGQ